MFGVVLGLIGWLALLSTVFVYAAEVNPVLAEHLWPRSIFTQGLTEQDRAALTSAVQAEVQAPQQAVAISYGDAAGSPVDSSVCDDTMSSVSASDEKSRAPQS